MSDPRCVLVTGGAGFVGGDVAVSLARRHPDWQVAALDNLRRRGAELTSGQPRRSARQTLADTSAWLEQHEADVLSALAA